MRTRSVVVYGMAIALMVVSGSAFFHKMVEFAYTMSGDEVAGFGSAALVTYFAGMIPLVCLTLWGVCTGRFRDVEGPATRMLELDREIEAAEGHPRD